MNGMERKELSLIFAVISGGHKSFFVGSMIPCFGVLVMSSLRFKVRVGSLIQTWQRHTWYMFPEIHLWCDTYWPLGRQFGSPSLSHMHVLAEVGCQIRSRISVRRAKHGSSTAQELSLFIGLHPFPFTSNLISLDIKIAWLLTLLCRK